MGRGCALTWDDVLAEGNIGTRSWSTREMQASHAAAAVDIAFDDPNLIGDGGLGSVVALAENVGLCGLVTDRVKITGADNSGGANAGAKVMTLLAVPLMFQPRRWPGHDRTRARSRVSGLVGPGRPDRLPSHRVVTAAGDPDFDGAE
jgi:hypothetical protein